MVTGVTMFAGSITVISANEDRGVVSSIGVLSVDHLNIFISAAQNARRVTITTKNLRVMSAQQLRQLLQLRTLRVKLKSKYLMLEFDVFRFV